MKNYILLILAISVMFIGCVKQTVNINSNNGGNGNIDQYTPPADSLISLIIGDIVLHETDINGNATNTIQQRRVLGTTFFNNVSVAYKFYGSCSVEMIVEVRDIATNTTIISRGYGVNVPTPTGTLTMGSLIPKGLYALTITITYIGNTPAKTWAYPFQVY